MATTSTSSYGAKDLQVLEGLEAVRKRPGMYIGSTGLNGLHHLVWEIVDNSVDEAMAGYATRIDVELLADGGCKVTDDGKELPVGPGRFSVTSRAGKGHALKRTTKIVRVTSAEPLAPSTPPALLN